VLGARRAIRAALAAVVACALVAGCGDSGDDPVTDLDEDDEAAVGDGAADDRLEQEAAAVAAYEANWNNLIAAGDPPDPDSPVLAEHATGEALAGFRSTLASYEAEGIAFRGSYEFDARATEVTATRAVVEDCGLDQTELVVIATGEVAEDSDDVRDGIVADLVLEDDAWKVTSLRDDPEVCG
jgi:hypothetical protein